MWTCNPFSQLDVQRKNRKPEIEEWLEMCFTSLLIRCWISSGWMVGGERSDSIATVDISPGRLSLFSRMIVITSVYLCGLAHIMTFCQITSLIIQSSCLQPSRSREGTFTMLKRKRFKALSICRCTGKRWFVLGEVLSVKWSIISTVCAVDIQPL